MNQMKLFKSQQQALADLGLYGGPIDGAWEQSSQLAIIGLEHTDLFLGCNPRMGGNAFAPYEPLPVGWEWLDTEDGCIVVVGDGAEVRLQREAVAAQEAEEHAAELKRQQDAETARLEAEQATALAASEEAARLKAEQDAIDAEVLSITAREDAELQRMIDEETHLRQHMQQDQDAGSPAAPAKVVAEEQEIS
jgi:hypothetical protein